LMTPFFINASFYRKRYRNEHSNCLKLEAL